jgi:ribosome-binding protein aMBF1 (putative translation factor)
MPDTMRDTARGCDLCRRAFRIAEPVYPVHCDGADLEVCVDCALELSRDGVGAWLRR